MMNQGSAVTPISMIMFHVLVLAASFSICTVNSQVITPAPIAATSATLAPATATLAPAAPAPTTIGAALTVAPAAPDLTLSTTAPAPTLVITTAPGPAPSVSTLAPSSLAAAPTFSDGVTLQDCQWDLATSDINGDGIITQNEYPVFLDFFGRRFCNEPTGVNQCGAVCLATWFTLTAAIGTGISVPISTLTNDQLLEICSRTASSIPKSCPAPTFFPSPTNKPSTKPGGSTEIPPTNTGGIPDGVTTSTAPIGSIPTMTTLSPSTALPGAVPVVPPATTLSPAAATGPTIVYGPVAPGVTAEDCHSDLVISDSDQNGVIDDTEYETFMAFYGFRVCYTPTPETRPSRQIIYTRLLCATNPATDAATANCNAATGIPYQPPLLTADLLNQVCTETYKLGMLSSTCTTPTTSPPAGGATFPPVVRVGGTGVPTIVTTNGTTTTATIAPTIVVGGGNNTSNTTTNGNDTAIPPPPSTPPTISPLPPPPPPQVPSGPSDATRIMTATTSRTGLLIIITAVAWLGV